MENNKRYIDQNAVTIITEIDPAKDIESLCEFLSETGKETNASVDFDKIKTLHFLRWFLIEEARPSNRQNSFDDQQKMPVSLAFTSNYDGDLDVHLQEILLVAKEAIVKIYSYCKGFPTSSTLSDLEIISFLKAHTIKNQLFWPAIRGGTAEQLKGESMLVSEIQNFINLSLKQGSFTNLSPEKIKEAIIHFVKNDYRLNWALTPRAKPSFSWKFKYYGSLIIKLTLLIPVLLLLVIFLMISGIFNKADNKNRADISRSQDFENLLKNEDRVFMNQLTVYGAIKRPYWYRRTQLRIGLWLFALNGKYRSNKGKLSGMETIHFARWALFNNNKNVMFLSNYDGAWEIYLSEFIDRSAAAMNLTFGTTVGFPMVKGLFKEGAHDEQSFKTVVRNNQFPCQVWHSTYPTLTVKNIRNNQAIRAGLAGVSKESVNDWLKRF
jgi:hypothetical protein